MDNINNLYSLLSSEFLISNDSEKILGMFLVSSVSEIKRCELTSSFYVSFVADSVYQEDCCDFLSVVTSNAMDYEYKSFREFPCKIFNKFIEFPGYISAFNINTEHINASSLGETFYIPLPRSVTIEGRIYLDDSFSSVFRSVAVSEPIVSRFDILDFED